MWRPYGKVRKAFSMVVDGCRWSGMAVEGGIALMKIGEALEGFEKGQGNCGKGI